jgi:hypothetical protein
MPTYAIIILVIVGTLLIYFLLGLFFYKMMGKYEKAVFAELNKMFEYEEGRGKKVLAAIDKLEAHGFSFDTPSYDFLQKGSADFASLTYEDKAKFKNTIDFTSLILAKIYREDKKYGKYLASEEAEEFEKMRSESDEKYKAYNKAAMHYNVFFNMIFTKGIMALKREKKTSAIIF